jgi:aspartate carbamoyltransferase catalytic subunit
MPDEYKVFCKKNNIPFTETSELADNFNDADILYMTRVQKERFLDLIEYERVKNVYTLKNNMLAHSRPNLRILHPLPRVNEIDQDVDESPKAYYFQQAQNGLYVRQAIMSKVLNV